MNKKDKIAICIGVVALIGVVIALILGAKKHKVETTTTETEVENEVITEIEVAKEDRSDEKPLFEDKRQFTEEELENEEWPEGSDSYEVDEYESPYVVTITNIEVMADEYNDYVNCMNLKYYIQVYLRNVTGDLDKEYTVTLVEGSCVNSTSTLVLTVDATVKEIPNVVLHIEYDKGNKAFGINSELGDYSLDALKRSPKHDILEYDPSIEVDESILPAPVTNM